MFLIIFQVYLLLFLFTCIHVCMQHACGYPQRSVKSIWSPQVGVIGSYVCTRSQTWVFCKSRMCSKDWDISLSCLFIYFFIRRFSVEHFSFFSLDLFHSWISGSLETCFGPNKMKNFLGLIQDVNLRTPESNFALHA